MCRRRHERRVDPARLQHALYRLVPAFDTVLVSRLRQSFRHWIAEGHQFDVLELRQVAQFAAPAGATANQCYSDHGFSPLGRCRNSAERLNCELDILAANMAVQDEPQIVRRSLDHLNAR